MLLTLIDFSTLDFLSQCSCSIICYRLLSSVCNLVVFEGICRPTVPTVSQCVVMYWIIGDGISTMLSYLTLEVV